MTISSGSSSARTTKTERCKSLVREMVMVGELLPGEKVHQASLAEKLKLSRIPVREALNRLHEEGLLDHTPNIGYTVTRFNRDDLHEIYLMRELLEEAIYDSLDLESVDAQYLRSLNARLSKIDSRENYNEFSGLNLEFHFTVFRLSPLRLVVREVEKLWRSASVYHSIYLVHTSNAERVYHEHEEIIGAIEDGDLDALIRASATHRNSTMRVLMESMGPNLVRR